MGTVADIELLLLVRASSRWDRAIIADIRREMTDT